MLDKFLREVVVCVVGKHAEEIAGLLNVKKHVNEFIIAKKLDITINQTRNILYKLSDQGLVSSIRKKDKKKGWYTYFWKIEVLKSLEFLRKMIVKRIEQIENQINSRETKSFYVCQRCNIEFTEENAMLYDFTCNECGAVFTVKDNVKVLREFKKHLNRFTKELELVDEEIRKETEKIDKQRAKVRKKEDIEKKKLAEEKKAARKIANAIRKAEREKLAAKSGKKKAVKKKVVKKKVAKKKAIKKKVVKKKVSGIKKALKKAVRKVTKKKTSSKKK